MQSSEPATQPAAVQLSLDRSLPPASSSYISPTKLSAATAKMTTQDDQTASTAAAAAAAAGFRPGNLAKGKHESSVTSPRAENGSVAVDNSSETGEEVISKDKLLPKVKQVSKCSYCESNSAESLKTVPCLSCGSRCHIDCIVCAAKFKHKILLGDDFFHFKCFKCTDGQERFKRYHLSWVDVVHITLFNLTHNPPVRPNSAANRIKADDPTGQFSSNEHGPQEYGDSRIYFHYKADVAKFIDQHWSYFWTKARGETWINSASSALSTNSTENVPEDGRFESGKAKYNKNGMWALTDDLRFPSSYDSAQQQKGRTVMYSFAEDGSLIELPSMSGNGRRKRKTEPVAKGSGVRVSKKQRASGIHGASLDGSGALAGDYVSAAGSSVSKRGGGNRGKREAKSSWSIDIWPDIDNPQGPVHMSREETHAAAQFVIESDRLTVWNDKGYRMAKASHGVETGAWYFEVTVLQPVRPEFNLRIGWSQISGELHAPCGYDVFSYSVRAKPSTRFHAAIGSPYGEEYGPGDTIGLLIYLPELDSDEKQDLIDRKWQPGEKYRQYTYSRPDSQRPYNADSELPPLPVLSGSELVYFKNGKCLGPAFQKLYLGKYYPAISSYMGGKVKVNLGPDFKYPPPATWHSNAPIRPISDLEYTLPPPTAAPTSESAPEPVSISASDSASASANDAAAATVTTEGQSKPATEALGFSAENGSKEESNGTASHALSSESMDIDSEKKPAELEPEPESKPEPQAPSAISESESVAAPANVPDTAVTSTEAAPLPLSIPEDKTLAESGENKTISSITHSSPSAPSPPSAPTSSDATAADSALISAAPVSEAAKLSEQSAVSDSDQKLESSGSAAKDAHKISEETSDS
ncbi:transcription factor, contains a PHD finger motif [Coemansia asiatica]|uniref:Transcription factor, contains a PHD finger motif n=1 Tax=Coemansia asiatica TaxID=1052880 RepID=A0A9W7XLE2_9FUNG|nr:transcription factor, contains a PHD finger motif [Coemansia asiatica]